MEPQQSPCLSKGDADPAPRPSLNLPDVQVLLDELAGTCAQLLDGFGDTVPVQLENYSDVLAELDPEFEEAAETARFLQQHVARVAITAPDLPRAARLIAVLAVGDVSDLIDEVRSGSGRAAMRSARTLVEHAVNIHSVISSEEAAERYMAHLDQGPVLLVDAPEGIILEPGPRRTATRNAQKAARSARPSWEASLARYGASFARQWHPTNLHDRAVAAGRGDLYTQYRVGSAVTHGSSTGAVGQIQIHESDVATYTAGKVPALVPLAFATGVDAYLQMLIFLEDNYPGFNVSGPASAMKRLATKHGTAVWRATNRVVQRYGVRARVVAYMAFSRHGKTRWYLRSSEWEKRWQPAATDRYTASLEEWLMPVRQAYIEQDGEFTEGGWAAIEVGPLLDQPDWTKRSIPAGTMPLIVMTEEQAWITGDVLEQGVMLNGWLVHEALDDPPPYPNSDS